MKMIYFTMSVCVFTQQFYNFPTYRYISSYLSNFSQQPIFLYMCLDVSKAFNRVWHKGLTFKVKQNGIDGDLLEWISDYLSGRKQKVVIRNTSSSLMRIETRVPQGSVIGLLLFLVYINDIAESLLRLTSLFADDSSLFYSAATIKVIEGIINHDLRVLVSWAAQWLINFNPLKTEVMLFTLRFIESLPNIIIDGTLIKFVTEHKHLGLTFSSNGQWHCHIENIIKSAFNVTGIMRKLKITFSRCF